jgi:hypothetical protein
VCSKYPQLFKKTAEGGRRGYFTATDAELSRVDARACSERVVDTAIGRRELRLDAGLGDREERLGSRRTVCGSVRASRVDVLARPRDARITRSAAPPASTSKPTRLTGLFEGVDQVQVHRVQPDVDVTMTSRSASRLAEISEVTELHPGDQAESNWPWNARGSARNGTHRIPKARTPSKNNDPTAG